MTSVLEDFASVRASVRGVVGLVPTMGFLHEGHLSLIAAAAESCDSVVVSVFVNPLQFGESVDLEAYPRDLARDVALAEQAGADIVFAPSVAAMLGEVEPRTSVVVSEVANAMEGVHRPGHFDGVATIVAKLFAGTQPDRAFFGRKDAQQLAVVRTMATDLSFPIEIVGAPLVRESDGLALSSRNVRIPQDARADAQTLFAGLSAGAERFVAGASNVAEVLDVVRSEVSPEVEVDYVAVADTTTAVPSDTFGGEQFLAIAGTVAGVRLIDNVTLASEPRTVDLGTRLQSSSILYEGGR